MPRINNWCSNQNPNKLHLDLLTNQSKHFIIKSCLFQSTQCLGETCFQKYYSQIFYDLSDVRYPPSQLTQISNREHHNCPLTSWQLPDEAYWFPGVIHTVEYTTPSGLRSFEITLLPHHQILQTHWTSGPEHLKAETKPFPRASTYIRHCQRALTRLRERGREFGERSVCSDTSAHGARREESQQCRQRSLCP